MTSFCTTLFIFRRDLRLNDNTGLIFALKHSEIVIPAFIFSPEQIEHNPYRGDASLQFMIESLEDLNTQLQDKGSQLYLFLGKPEEVVERLIRERKVDHVTANRDYTPYSQKRDDKIQKICTKHHIHFELFEDALLHPPEDTLKADGKPYTVFTPYYRRVSTYPVRRPEKNRFKNYYHGSIKGCVSPDIYRKILANRSSTLAIKGGRTEAEKQLKSLKKLSAYTKDRDFPALNCVSHLSAYLKFTVLSPREVYHEITKQLGKDHALIRALYWRDFFTAIAFFFPHVFTGAFHKKFDQLKWDRDQNAFKKWCEGKTGFPLIDAGMRELNQTGFMHNRVRMIVASFLCKDLYLNWRLGEKYFAQKLIDYDPAVNNGNWQWSASTGCDAQPYFRIFNPWNQQKKFDPDCVYIKKWVPELKHLSPEQIHRWDDAQNQKLCPSYPAPMVDHTLAAKNTLTRYKKALDTRNDDAGTSGS